MFGSERAAVDSQFDRPAAPVDAVHLDALRLALAGEHRLIQAQFQATQITGHLALADGDIGAAERASTALLDRAMRLDLPNLFLLASSLLYDVRRAQGRLAELLPWFARRAERGERIPRVGAMRAQVLVAAGRYDEAAVLLSELTAGDLAAITPAERPHSIATLAEVACELGDAAAASVLRAVMQPWAALVVYDGTNGPVVPVADYLARLDGLLAG